MKILQKRVLIVVLFIPFLLPGQQPAPVILETLLRELSVAKEDTGKVKLLDTIASSYSTIDADKGIWYGGQAKLLAETLGWKKGLAASHVSLGMNYEAKSFNSQALQHYRKALELYQELGLRKQMASVLEKMCMVYFTQCDYSSALEHGFRSLKINEELHDIKRAAVMNERIGNIYLRQKKYTQAMLYYSAALKTQEEFGDKPSVARLWGNMGVVHGANGDHEKSLTCYSLALESNESEGNKTGIQVNLMNIGIAYCRMKEYSRGLVYQVKALRMSEEEGTKRRIALNYGNLGETYLRIAQDPVSRSRPDSLVQYGTKANLDVAITYLGKAVAICEAIGYSGPLIEFNQLLAEAYSLSGDFEKAYAISSLNAGLKDSVSLKENFAKINTLETERALLLKDKEIELRDKELEIGRLAAANERKESFIYLGGIALLLVIACVIIRMFVKRVKMQRAALSDIANMQSHEIRGPVARILGLTQLLNRHDPGDTVNKEVISHIRDVSLELDENIRKVITKTTGKDAGKTSLIPAQKKSTWSFFHRFKRNNKPGKQASGPGASSPPPVDRHLCN